MKIVYVIERKDTQQWYTIPEESLKSSVRLSTIPDSDYWVSDIHNALQWDKQEEAEVFMDIIDTHGADEKDIYVTEHQIG